MKIQARKKAKKMSENPRAIVGSSDMSFPSNLLVLNVFEKKNFNSLMPPPSVQRQRNDDVFL